MFIIKEKCVIDLYDFKRNSVVFKDICYGSEIVFTMSKLGSIEVKGTVYADGMQHSLTFCFNTDQSVFLPFIRKLKKMVENADKQNWDFKVLQPPFFDRFETFWSLDPRRKCRLSDEKMSDFDPKMCIFQSFWVVF